MWGWAKAGTFSGWLPGIPVFELNSGRHSWRLVAFPANCNFFPAVVTLPHHGGAAKNTSDQRQSAARPSG